MTTQICKQPKQLVEDVTAFNLSKAEYNNAFSFIHLIQTKSNIETGSPCNKVELSLRYMFNLYQSDFRGWLDKLVDGDILIIGKESPIIKYTTYQINPKYFIYHELLNKDMFTLISFDVINKDDRSIELSNSFSIYSDKKLSLVK